MSRNTPSSSLAPRAVEPATRLEASTPESLIDLDRLARIDPAVGIALTVDEIAGLLRRPRSRPLIGPAEILRVLSEPT
jgi:hypothetical protein